MPFRICGYARFRFVRSDYTARSMRRLKTDPVPPNIIVKVVEAAPVGLERA